MLRGFRDVLAEAGIEGPSEVEENPDFGTPDELITTTIDCSAVAGRKYASLAAHASQSDNIFFLQMGEELFSTIMGSESFVRVLDSTGRAGPRGRPLRRAALDGAPRRRSTAGLRAKGASRAEPSDHHILQMGEELIPIMGRRAGARRRRPMPARGRLDAGPMDGRSRSRPRGSGARPVRRVPTTRAGRGRAGASAGNRSSEPPRGGDRHAAGRMSGRRRHARGYGRGSAGIVLRPGEIPRAGPAVYLVDERIAHGRGRAVRRGAPGRHGRGGAGGRRHLRPPLPAAGLRPGLLHDRRRRGGRGRRPGGDDQGLAPRAGLRPPAGLGDVLGAHHHPQPGHRRAAPPARRADRPERLRRWPRCGATSTTPRTRRTGPTPAHTVRAALEVLSDEQRRAVVLAAVYGRTASEISESEGIPLGTAKTRIRTALIRLRAAVEHAEGGER